MMLISSSVASSSNKSVQYYTTHQLNTELLGTPVRVVKPNQREWQAQIIKSQPWNNSLKLPFSKLSYPLSLSFSNVNWILTYFAQ